MQNDKRRNLFSSPARRDNFFLSLGLMLPTILIVLIIAIYPLIKSFDISLRYFNLMKPEKGTPYVWLRNYQFVLTDQKFWRSVRSTAIFTILSVALVLFFALAIALLLNRRFPGKIELSDDFSLEEFEKLVKLCPAALYRLGEDGSMAFDYAGCLECGTCRIACGDTVVKRWENPQPLQGIEYRFG